MSSPDRFCDNRYKNWLKCGLALILMKEDLHQFVHNQVQTLHTYLINKVSPLICGTSATFDCKVCTWRDIKYDRHRKKWDMNCRNNICNKWLQEIVAVHKTPDNPKINWWNCDVSQWPSDPYQVAKAFMPNGQANVTKLPEDLDPPAILSLLYYCSFLCNNVPNPQILHDLIEVRNLLFHSGNFYVEDSDKDTWINNMLQLLQDLKLNGTKIEKIKREDLDINFRETEIKVLETLVSTLNSDFKTMCAALNIKINSSEDCQKEQEEKIGKLQVSCSENNVKVVTMETKMESFEKFTQDFIPVKTFFDNNCDILDHDFRNKNTETMSNLQDCFEILKTKLESTDAELTSIKSRVEGVEDLDKKVSGYRVDLENFFKKLEMLSGGFVKIQPVVNKWNKKENSEEKNMKSTDQTLGDQEQQDRMPAAWTFTKEEIDRAWVLMEEVLVEDLAPSYILSSLTFLSDNEHQAICQMESRGEMVKELLPKVKEQLPDNFCILLNALKEKGPEQLVEKLVKIINGTCILNYAPPSNMSSLTMKLNVKREDGTIVSNTEIEIAGSINRFSSVFSEDLQLIVTEVTVGSVIIHLKPLTEHAQMTLAFFCKHGGMKDLILNLLRKENIYASLPIGEVFIEVEVCCREEDVVSKDASESMRDFASESFEIVSTDHVIKENLRLQYGRLLDEIEPLHLKKTFTDKGILDEFFLELRDLERRRERAAYFLDKLLAIGSDEALLTLVDALKESGRENLATSLVAKRTPYLSDTDDVDEKLIQVVKVSHKHAEGSILWSCCLKVTVENNDDVEDMEGDDDFQEIFMKLEQVQEPEEEEVVIKTIEDMEEDDFQEIFMKLEQPEEEEVIIKTRKEHSMRHPTEEDKVKIVRQYSRLKYELSRKEMGAIGDELFKYEHLDFDELKQIADKGCSRRKASELLLNIIINGTPTVIRAFMKILNTDQQFEYIRYIIEKTQISDEEKKRFIVCEDISLGRQDPSSITHSRQFHLSASDTDVLIHELNDEELVDSISDSLFSNFYISCRDHKRILNLESVRDKVKELISLMKNCSDSVYDVFAIILEEKRLHHVLQKLEINRTHYLKRKVPEKQHIKIKKISMDDDEKQHMKMKRISMDDDETPLSLPS